MTNKERIERFEQENEPFTLYENDNGSFTLGLRFSFFKGKYEDYCRNAFIQYAKIAGDPVKVNGLYTHGNGYEWESVFQKAFEQDERLQQIVFDSEAGSFFCNSDSLDILEDFGRRFRVMCEDEKSFADLVCQALSEAEQESAYHRENKTVKWHIEGASRWSMEIVTPEHHLCFDEGQGVDLCKGKAILVKDSISGEMVEVNSKELLRYQVTYFDEDGENRHVRMNAEPIQSEDLANAITM